MENVFKDNFIKIKKEVEDFTLLIDQNIGVEFGEHSCAYTDTNDIVIGIYSTLYRDNVVDLAHEQYYRDNGFNYEDYNIKYETFIILHEIGHLQTIPTKKEKRKYKSLQKRINNSKMTDYQKLISYFKLNVEFNADKWAMDYIKKFPIVVQNLDFVIHIYKKRILRAFEK